MTKQPEHKRSNIVTNSIKTLPMAHIKNICICSSENRRVARQLEYSCEPNLRSENPCLLCYIVLFTCTSPGALWERSTQDRAPWGTSWRLATTHSDLSFFIYEVRSFNYTNFNVHDLLFPQCFPNATFRRCLSLSSRNSYSF